MKGTPNQKTLMLEMPGGKMSAQDLQTIKKAYGLPADISFQQTQELLKKIEASDRETLLAPIDIFEKGTHQNILESLLVRPLMQLHEIN